MIHAIKILVMPPASLFLLFAAGLLCARRRPRLGRALMVSSACLLVLLSIPLAATLLLTSLQTDPALPPGDLDHQAEAICVLSGDAVIRSPEFGRDTLGALTLVRVRYAARLAKRTGLPILTSGGPGKTGTEPLAGLMRDVLVDELGARVDWTEERSRTTRENARLSAEILSEAGITRVFLVTHAWHMPRARRSFEASGLEVIAAPTGFRTWSGLDIGDFLPSARALQQSSWALHEWIGRVWYALS